jgi:hypothetical protein
MNDFQSRLLATLASSVVIAKRPPSAAPWPLQLPAPPDVAAFHAACDGLELEHGVRILGREEVGISTKWLRDEKSLLWEDDIFIIGERDDLVVVRDMDLENVRAGGGILEAPTDGLESLKRVALDIVGYLEIRVGLRAQGLEDAYPAPERLVQIGVSQRNAEMLERALTRPFYPGNEADAALAALTLGEIRAQSGALDAALQAFEQYAALRARAARRGAESIERSAAFRAAARTAESVGAKDLADLCRQRAKN